MITSLVGKHLDALDTPALLIEQDVLRTNVELMMSELRKHGVEWRPAQIASRSASANPGRRPWHNVRQDK